MAGVRSLADGHLRWTVLTEPPANPAAPTAAELNAGIYMSRNVLASDFLWGFAESDRVQEKPLSETSNAQAIGAGNPQGRATFFRYFDPETGNGDPVDDQPFQIHKIKGTTLYAYARETAKLASEPWEDGDEIYLGAEYVTDEPAPPSSRSGFIKYTVPFELQYTYPHIVVADGLGD